MFMKKFLVSALCAVCALSLLVPAAFAHGGCHGRGSARQYRIPVCTAEDCELTGRHYHGATLYCGNAHANGVCDGTCLPLCTVEGCTLTGRHSHNGVTYCGNDHACGFCDGSCPVYSSASSRGCRGGCHGARR